jgi:hypothetical protein
MYEGKKMPVSTPEITDIEDVLNGFAEAMSRLMIDNRQAAAAAGGSDLTLIVAFPEPSW